MQPNELRIGNLLKYQGENWCISSIFQNGTLELVRFKIYKIANVSEIEPISLTEEWLLMFKEIEKKADGLFIFKLPFDYEIRIIEGKKGYTFWTQNTLLFLGTDSVHKLQNLFFALKSEELTPA